MTQECKIKSVEVLIPAKVMLFGEYSVLKEGLSLAITLDKNMKIFAKNTDDSRFCVESDLWDNILTWSKSKKPVFDHETEILGEIVSWCCTYFKINGLELSIKSSWSVTDGFGSSSALRLGVVVALAALSDSKWLKVKPGFPEGYWELAKIAYQDQLRKQGFASGYDIATQLEGGLVTFQGSVDIDKWPKKISSSKIKTKFKEFVHIYLGGKGAPTSGVGSKTIAWLNDMNLFEDLKKINEELRESFLNLEDKKFSLKDSEEFFEKVEQFRKIMQESPFFPVKVSQELEKINGLNKLWTYKTSGAGGEDALLVFGHEAKIIEVDELLKPLGWKKLESHYPADGLTINKIEEPYE